MLRAAERHALPFLKDLTNEAASAFLTEYTRRYRPWDRLPVQKEIVRALKEQA